MENITSPAIQENFQYSIKTTFYISLMRKTKPKNQTDENGPETDSTTPDSFFSVFMYHLH
jgi:hypothetical protein